MIDSRTFYNFANAPLYIGYHGENLVTGVDIDLANVMPDGWTAALLLRRSGESEAYPATSTLVGKMLRVVYSTADSAIEGRGEATIQLMGGNGEIMKSQTALTIVTHALNIGEPPDPVVHWLYEMEHRLIPTGGTTGQVLTKTGAADYNVEWEDPQGGGGDKPYLSLERVSRYLYNVSFANALDVNADFAPAGGCSAYVKDGNLYRNLDWSYDHEATFHVRLPGIEGLAFMAGLTDTELDNDLIAQLPYRMVDGINEHGIMMSTHVLYNDWDAHGHGTIPLTRLPYLVLSRVKSMATIEDDLNGVLDNLITTPALDAMEYLIQVLVTDGTTTYVLRPGNAADGTYEAVDITENPKLSNFWWVPDETVTRQQLQNRPTGVERWNMMPCPMEELRFTKAYEEPTRLSEFIGLRGTTKDSTDEELTEIYEIAHGMYLERTRDGSLWQTMHSVVYSSNGLEHLWIQEDWEKDYIASAGGEEHVVSILYGEITYDEAAEIIDSGKTIDVILIRSPKNYVLRLSGQDTENIYFTAEDQFGIITVALNSTTGWGEPILTEIKDEIVYFEYGVATYEEVKAAYDAGKTILVFVVEDPDDDPDIKLFFNLLEYGKNENNSGQFTFSLSTADVSIIGVLMVILSSDGWSEPYQIFTYDSETISRAIESKADVEEVGAAINQMIDQLQEKADLVNGKVPVSQLPTFDAYDIFHGSETVGHDLDDLEDAVSAINEKIPSGATSSNQLVTEQTMGDAIEAVEAKQIYKTSTQGSFATKAELLAATTFYNADGTVATPTKNDVAYVLADETHDGKAAKYVIADVTSGVITWGFVITFSNTAFSQAQMDAINSGATAAKIGEIDTKAEIDDTAGDGDTDKTWSADKLVEEFGEKVDASAFAQRTVTISAADWNGGTTVTKTVLGVTATNSVIVDPSDATVECTAQAADSLTFTAEDTPTENVTVKVVILP